MSTKNKEIVEKVNASFAENKPEVFLSFCANNVEWTIVGDKSFNGKDPIREFMSSTDGMVPPDFTVDEIIAEGDSVVCYGDMTMADNDGNASDYSYCDVYRFRNDEIIKLQTFIVKHKNAGESSEKAAA